MCNVGLVDRIFRGVLGFALIVSALYGFEWGWLGLIPLATAFMGFLSCLYFGWYEYRL